MKSTNAADVIIHALWPGPGPLIFEETFASVASAPRVPLLTYASRSATRCSRVGSALAAGAAGAAAGVSGGAEAFTSSAAQTCASVSPLTTISENRVFFMWIIGSSKFGYGLNSGLAFFFRANANGIFDIRYKNFSVTDLAGLGRLHDRRNGRFHLAVGQHPFDFDFRQEIHRLFAAAINFRVAFLAAESFHFGNGHSFDAHVSEGILHFFELEWFYDCFDFLHIL